MASRDVRFVTKPLGPPWNDSGKNLPWSLASRLTRHRARVWTPQGVTLPPSPSVVPEPLLAAAGRFRNPMAANAEMLARLLAPDPAVGLTHFFFTPTPLTAKVAGLVRRVKMRTPMVQNVNSLPRVPETLARLVFGDRVVVLSRHAETVLRAAGLQDKVVRIAPFVPLLDPGVDAAVVERPGRPTFVYAGDLEFSRGGLLLTEAIPAVLRRVEADFVFACRAKTPRAGLIERTIKLLLAARHVPTERVQFVGEVADLPQRLAAATALVLPVDTLYAKMDLPLVALEALQLGTPCVLGDAPPLAELAEAGGSVQVQSRDAGLLVDVLVAMATDRRRWLELSEAARVAWRTRYHPDVVVPAYEQLYDDLLAGRAP